MGRHSSPGRWHYLLSVAGYALSWVVGAAVVGGALWVAVNAVGGDAADVTPTATPTDRATSEARATPTPSPTPTRASPEKDGDGREANDDGGAGDGTEFSLAGVSAQVLNGTGGVEGAAAAMADRLAREGLEIIAIDTAYGNFSETTVYWSSAAAEKPARALAERFGWIAKPKPARLSASVDLHVIVGLDEV